MDRGSYVSCIKINGVPILPPLMTEEIIHQMTYYKQLAITVEKRLSDQRVAEQPVNHAPSGASIPIYKPMSSEGIDRTTENDSVTDNVTDVELDMSPTITTVIHVPVEGTNTVTDSDLSMKNSNEELGEIVSWSINSDEENKIETDTNVVSSDASRSQSISTSTDLNHSSADTVSTRSTNTDLPVESYKPQVPKTLDIVPLSLSSSDYKSHEMQEETDNTLSTPKLVRQGSYILDSPSPMLLAHMQTELCNLGDTSPSEYIPTTTNNATRRKEWNIAEAKIQWQRSKDEDVVVGDSTENYNREPLNVDYSSKSIDCIQRMLAKEDNARNNGDCCYSNKHMSPPHSEKLDRLPKSKTEENCSVLNATQKLGGSLGNLANSSTDFCKSIKTDFENVSLNNSSIESTLDNMDRRQTSKLKSSITTDKLLEVYKEIQRMHQSQMTELVNRQQREQTLLQKEFERQQILLLKEIKKSFPKININSLSENVSSVSSAKQVHDNEQILKNNSTVDTLFEVSKNEINNLKADKSMSCPLDHIYPVVLTQTGHECDTICTRSNCQLVSINTTESDQPGIDDDQSQRLQGSSERKRLSVSRELFPLDSKTVHVPVLGNGVYDNKHIRATTVINAYTRGYLVRRLMKTDRVIALKNTYKEALHCMLKLHVEAPLKRSEYNFLHRLQLQCDAASMNIVELFAQSSEKRMKIISQDREIKRSRAERPTSARSYSFATQRTLARKKLKEMGDYQPPPLKRVCSARSRCQTWTSDVKEKLISPVVLYQSIKRSTSAGTVRKPWR